MKIELMAPFHEPQVYSLLKESNVLFDADAVIKILHFKAEYILQKLQAVNACPVYTHQVYLELMITNNIKDRIARQIFLSQNNFELLSHIIRVIPEKAAKLQEELHKLDCRPSPTDLYLGACLEQVATGSTTYLMTSNIKDFPSPVFEKAGFLILNGSKNVQVLTLIKFTGYSKFERVSDDDIPF